jgi:acyl-CoA synthetase (AMP-forming)/AMP-acid ligase II
MIITGAENISPAEIESVLSLHPAVAEVAVAGLPHAFEGYWRRPDADARALRQGWYE